MKRKLVAKQQLEVGQVCPAWALWVPSWPWAPAGGCIGLPQQGLQLGEIHSRQVESLWHFRLAIVSVVVVVVDAPRVGAVIEWFVTPGDGIKLLSSSKQIREWGELRSGHFCLNTRFQALLEAVDHLGLCHGRNVHRQFVEPGDVVLDAVSLLEGVKLHSSFLLWIHRGKMGH